MRICAAWNVRCGHFFADHLQDLEAAAHDTLEARLPGREVVGGTQACWHAAVSESPELLLVEDGYAMPARLSSDGSMLAPRRCRSGNFPTSSTMRWTNSSSW